MAFEKGRNSKLYILVESNDDEYGTWRRVKTYWAKKDGSRPKSLLDEIDFWQDKPWLRPEQQSNVKLELYEVDTTNATEVEI